MLSGDSLIGSVHEYEDGGRGREKTPAKIGADQRPPDLVLLG